MLSEDYQQGATLTGNLVASARTALGRMV